ncbi:MAG: hypothetical protein ACPF8V_03200 [Luteibaculum sp.]
MKTKLILALLLIAAAIVAVYMLTQKKESTISGFDTEFAVEDPESLSRIFIATSTGSVADLKKKDGTWYINDKYEARKDAIDFVKETLAELRVHAPVLETAQENHLRSLASTHKKIELYKDGEDTPYKTIYLGKANQTLNANIALLETRKNGKGNRPYYIEKIGHKGILGPIFFTMEMDWMSTSVFNYPNLNIDYVKVEYPKSPLESFKISKKGEEYSLEDPATGISYSDKEVNRFALKEFTGRFSKVHFESINVPLNAMQQDSVLRSTPMAIISVKPVGGEENSISLFEAESELVNIDLEQIGYGTSPNVLYGDFQGQFVKCQRFVFDNLLFKRSDFLIKR